MKILVAVRQVPDAESRLEVSEGNLDLSRASLVLDGMDEYAVEEALLLREAGLEAELIAVAVGAAALEETFRAALAMGLDRARLLVGELADPLAVARAVAEVARDEQADLILTGSQQSDWDSQALGPAIAACLGWPQVSWCHALQLDGGVLRGRHDVEGGSAAFEVALPAVVTTQQGLNEPRYPTLPNIRRSRSKEVRSESIPVTLADGWQLVAQGSAAKARLGQRIAVSDPQEAAAELLSWLEQTAKVRL